MNAHDPDRTIILHDNRFTMANTRSFELGLDHYVLPSQCKQIIYAEVPGRAGWPFVVRYDRRARLVKYNVEEEDYIEEEEDVEEKDIADASDQELEEDESNVMGHNAVLDDDVNEDMLENDIDDDVDITNPLNTFSKSEDIDVSWTRNKNINDTKMLKCMRYVITMYFA